MTGPEPIRRLRVTIEHWLVYRAWVPDQVFRWAICHAGSPIGPTYDTPEQAAEAARCWGMEVVIDHARHPLDDRADGDPGDL